MEDKRNPNNPEYDDKCRCDIMDISWCDDCNKKTCDCYIGCSCKTTPLCMAPNCRTEVSESVMYCSECDLRADR